MKNGLVFGKYYPFHKGHQALIAFAAQQCDRLFVVVCASHQENIASNIRANWIKETFNNVLKIEVVELNYDESVLPNTSVSSLEVSEIWSAKFKEILPRVDVLITSEPYGDYVANFMDAEHILFGKERVAIPISATQIRENTYDNWDYLPDAVKKYYQKKVVFLGTECTGKSSISKAVSEQFNSSLVEEIGRDIVENSEEFNTEQLLLIAKLHAQSIEKSSAELKPFVFIDTDIYITQSYAKFAFGEYLDIPQGIYDTNKSDIYFYLNNDLEFIQDGTRMDVKSRDILHQSHIETLQNFDVKFVKISGDWEIRYDKIISILRNEIDS